MAQHQERIDPLSLTKALAATDVGVWTWDAATSEVRWSPTLESLYGLPLGGFSGTFEAFQDFIHPEDRGLLLQTVQQAMESNTKFRLEHRILRPDGSVRWLDGRGEPFEDESGRPAGMVGTAIDITDRKQAQEEAARLAAELESNERRLRSLLQHSYDAVAVVDHQGTFTYISPSIYRILGYQPEDLLGTSGFALIHPDELPDAQAAFVRALGAPRSPVQVEFRAHRSDGSWPWLEVVGTNLIEEATIGGVVVNFRDITERKNAEAALAARLRQQATLAELGQRALSAPDLQALMDEAADRVAHVLEVEYCTVLELLPNASALLLRAGTGWQEGLIGQATVGNSHDSQAGYTLQSSEPVIVDDLRKETRFTGPRLLWDHNVVSGLSVIIAGERGPFGVMGAHTAQHRTFNEDDVTFLQAVASLVAIAIQRQEHELAIRRLSTPTLKIMPRTLLVPVVGQLDNQRAMQMANSLLKSIREHRARLVILDVTGLAYFEQDVMPQFSQMVAASRLLGAEVLISGISAALADALVRVGMGLGRVRTVGDLQSAIQEAGRGTSDAAW